MKICWDNLEKLRYSKKTGKWYDKKRHPYIYREECKECKEPFLSQPASTSNYCCHKCSQKGSNNSFYNKKHSNITKEKISRKGKNRVCLDSTKQKLRLSRIGKKHTKESKRKISKLNTGRYIRSKSYAWDGGYNSKNIPKYDTYAFQIEWCEEVRRSSKDKNVLEVKCTYCGRWYVPTKYNVRNRIQSLKTQMHGECRFYCSEQCKQACPIYSKKPECLMKEDALRAGRLGWLELNREVQPELRQLVLRRDEYACQKCDTTDKPLHCHHILPVATDPIESADIDNCITLCEDCHREAHKQDGCRTEQLKMEIC